MGALAMVVEYLSAQVVLVFLSTCAIAFLIHTQTLKKDNIPSINDFPRDWSRTKAQAAFVRDAQGLMHEGFKKVRRITPEEPIDFSSRCAPVQRPLSHHHAAGFEGNPSD
jgi:hypothetical protein